MSYRTDGQLATDNGNISTLGGVDATKIEKVELQALVTNIIDSKRNNQTWERGWYDVTNNPIATMVAGGDDNKTAFQALLNYLIDNGGGHLYFPPGKYDIDGALADTGNANAQVYFKQVSLNEQQVSITLIGSKRPPNQLFTESVLPEAGYSVIRSTLTGASGTAACIGSQRENGFSLIEQNNVSVTILDMIFEAPVNPTFTMLDLRCTQSGTIDGVLIHAGNVQLDTIVQPTSSTSYGIKLSDYSHTPATIVGRLDVWGFYIGIRLAELCIGNAMRVWGCRIGMETSFCYHGNILLSFGSYWCQTGIKSNGGESTLIISYYDIEDANGNGQAWQDSIYYLDDSGNDITGEITYDAILGGFGRTSQWLINGGSNLICKRIGTTKLMKYTPANSTDNTHAAGTVTVDDTYIYFRDSAGTWKKIAWTTF